MPLSDEEQKILQEIEAQLHATDPDLAEQVSKTTLYRHAARSIKWAALGFVLGLLGVVLLLSTSIWGAFGGFVVMLACVLVIERNLRKLGRAGLQSITGRSRNGGIRDSFGEAVRGWKERFQRGNGNRD